MVGSRIRQLSERKGWSRAQLAYELHKAMGERVRVPSALSIATIFARMRKNLSQVLLSSLFLLVLFALTARAQYVVEEKWVARYNGDGPMAMRIDVVNPGTLIRAQDNTVFIAGMDLAVTSGASTVEINGSTATATALDANTLQFDTQAMQVNNPGGAARPPLRHSIAKQSRAVLPPAPAALRPVRNPRNSADSSFVASRLDFPDTL